MGAMVQSCNSIDPTPDPTWINTPNQPVLAGVVSTVAGPLSDAVVSVDVNGETVKAITNAKGEYTIQNLKSGSYTVSCAAAGGKKYTGSLKKVEMENDKVTVCNIVLSEIGDKTIALTGQEQTVSVNLPALAKSAAETQMVQYVVGEDVMTFGDDIAFEVSYYCKQQNATKGGEVPAGYA